MLLITVSLKVSLKKLISSSRRSSSKSMWPAVDLYSNVSVDLSKAMLLAVGVEILESMVAFVPSE